LSAQQIRRIGVHHQRAEEELDAAEEELERAGAKVRRLRKQKKMWLDKMMRAVSRGIDSVEELERVEREEAEEAARRLATPASSALSSEPVFSEIEIDPVLLQEGVELSPSWFVGIGVSGPGDIVEQAGGNSPSV
jgi:hypothetical protein